MKSLQRMSLVKRNENTLQEKLMFLLERYGKTVDYRAENLEQLGNTIEFLYFVDEPQENIIDLLAYEGSQAEKFSIDAM